MCKNYQEGSSPPWNKRRTYTRLDSLSKDHLFYTVLILYRCHNSTMKILIQYFSHVGDRTYTREREREDLVSEPPPSPLQYSVGTSVPPVDDMTLVWVRSDTTPRTGLWSPLSSPKWKEMRFTGDPLKPRSVGTLRSEMSQTPEPRVHVRQIDLLCLFKGNLMYNSDEELVQLENHGSVWCTYFYTNTVTIN